MGRPQEERAFLLYRAVSERLYEEPRWHGISSDALVTHVVLGGPSPSLRDYPLDPSDMLACEITVRRLPAHLKAAGEAVLALYRPVVEERCSLAEMDAWLVDHAETVPHG